MHRGSSKVWGRRNYGLGLFLSFGPDLSFSKGGVNATKNKDI